MNVTTTLQNTYQTLGQNIQTSNATPIAVSLFQTKPKSAYIITARVVAQYADFSAGAGYIRSAAFRTNGANTITQIGATGTTSTFEDTASMDCELLTTTASVVINGVATTTTGIVCRITGVAATVINWRCEMTITEVGWDSDIAT